MLGETRRLEPEAAKSLLPDPILRELPKVKMRQHWFAYNSNKIQKEGIHYEKSQGFPEAHTS